MRLRKRSKSAFQKRWKSLDLKYISKQKQSFWKSRAGGTGTGSEWHPRAGCTQHEGPQEVREMLHRGAFASFGVVHKGRGENTGLTGAEVQAETEKRA